MPASGEYVVKPAVSAGSRNTNRYVAGDHDDLATDHVRSLLDAGRTVMVQPYLDAIDTDGETALLYFGGEFSHAVRKGPLLEPAMALVTGRLQAGDDAAQGPVAGRAGSGRSGAGRVAVDRGRCRAQ